ncbi:hypothetical protein [Niabella hibiscisoli]|uniref:hypothetical protein n=1 Tax=Niabella hibiscisoli TaxID=1825928 RepID=UPI001F0DD044|nr:hypothetical protein [Niabella hibiscisoli]MCH5716574.1 hypothetical protein [Niabella hibiscisoli]
MKIFNYKILIVLVFITSLMSCKKFLTTERQGLTPLITILIRVVRALMINMYLALTTI